MWSSMILYDQDSHFVYVWGFRKRAPFGREVPNLKPTSVGSHELSLPHWTTTPALHTPYRRRTRSREYQGKVSGETLSAAKRTLGIDGALIWLCEVRVLITGRAKRMFELEGARVVITGAAGGVGRALCAAFAGVGAQIVGCDRVDQPVPDQCAESHGFDLADPEGVAEAARIILAGGVPRVVISNAGWTRAEVMGDVTPETFAAEMEGNFTGTARFSAALLPAMRDGAGDRNFVFVSSVNAQMHFGNPVYSAAKAAGLAWMRAIATEEGCHGIRANAVVPASIRTEAWDHRLKADPRIMERLAPLYPLGRFVAPREVANAVLFLASPLASGITGAALNVDAGLAAGNLPFINALAEL